MQTEKLILTLSVLAVAPLTKLRFVNFSGTQAVAADATLGVANANYDAGEQAGVNASGELLVEAGAAIAAGAVVQSDASGRAITLAAGVAAMHAKDLAGALICCGIMGHLALQVILNIAVVTNTIPNTGITLPFISYGGTSAVFLLGEMGLAMNVGKCDRIN